MALPQKRSQPVDRKDPPQRKLEGYHSTALRNADPSKVYRFAYIKDEDTGVTLYEHLGFEKVVSQEGGVQMAIKKTPLGELVMYRGHVLMQADKAEMQARWQAMQEEASEREKAIVKNRSGVDPMRGINRGVLARGELQVVNETSELVPE